MNAIDYILLVILAYFILQGIRHGFLSTAGSIVGIVVGAWAAGVFYPDLAQVFIEYFEISIMFAIVASFIAIFLGINIVITISINILTHIFRYIPLATFANRVFGGLLGLVQGVLLVGLLIWVITLFPFETSFAEKLEESTVAEYFENSTRLVQPLLPRSLRDVDFSVLKDLKNLSDEKAEYIRENIPTFFERIRQQSDDLEQSVEEEIQKNGDSGV